MPKLICIALKINPTKLSNMTQSLTTKSILLLVFISIFSCTTEYNEGLQDKQKIQISKHEISEKPLNTTVLNDSVEPLVNAKNDTLIPLKKYPFIGSSPDKDSLVEAYSAPINLRTKTLYHNNNYIDTNDIVEYLGKGLTKIGKNKIDYSITEDIDSYSLKVEKIDTFQTTLPTPTIGSSYTMFSLGYDEGLGNQRYNSVHQDHSGSIWLGESRNLKRYDGTSLINYALHGKFSINSSTSIVEDQKGNIWMTSEDERTVRYDGKAFHEYKFKDSSANKKIASATLGSEGEIWFSTATNGILRFKNNTFQSISKSNGLVNDTVVEIKKLGNEIIILTNGGISVIKKDEITNYKINKQVIDGKLKSFSKLNDGTFWIGTSLGLYSSIAGNTTQYYRIADKYRVFDLLLNSKDKLWIASTTGLLIFEGDHFINLTKSDGLISDYIRNIYEDHDQNIWAIGTNSYSSIIDLNGFIKYSPSEEYNSQIHSIDQWNEDKLLIGTFNSGLRIFDKSSVKQLLLEENINIPLSLKDITSPSVVEDKNGNYWIGTFEGLIHLEKEKITIYQEENGLIHSAVTNTFQDSKGNLWIASWGMGLSKFDGEKFTHYKVSDGLLSGTIESITEDKNGTIWLASPKGLSAVSNDSIYHLSEENGLLKNNITNITSDRDGDLWFISSWKKGVSYFNGETIYYFNKQNGLSHNAVQSIQPDKNGNIWIKTMEGLDYLEIRKKESEIIDFSICHFNITDGFKIREMLNANFIDKNNNLWIAGKGKSKYNIQYKPEVPKKSKSRSPQISNLKIRGNEIDYSENMDKEYSFDSITPFTRAPKSLKLNYAANHLTFKFNALNFSNPYKTKYKYRLRGYEKNWSNAISNGVADYKNLPIGEFIFEVKSRTNGNEWSDSTSLAFEVYPPFYLTFWAYLFYFLFFILIMYVYSKVRFRRLENKQRNLEFKISEATEEIRSKNSVLKTKNKEITDSINYAKRIQNTILPSRYSLAENIENGFILFKPKDVVSGDFYWVERVGETVYFAAADCTGHGVPGALISVICANALSKALIEEGIKEPGSILNRTRDLVIDKLQRGDDDIKDGMDISLCAYNNVTQKLQWAGANNPLWIISKKENDYQLAIIKPNKQPIGSYHNHLPFETHNLDLKKGDTIYLFSDGFVDQFGGEKGKKYKVGKFRDFLLSIQHYPIEKHKELLDQELKNWMGDYEQVDDICIVGVRI